MFTHKHDKASNLINIYLLLLFPYPSHSLSELQLHVFQIHLLLHSFQMDAILAVTFPCYCQVY